MALTQVSTGTADVRGRVLGAGWVKRQWPMQQGEELLALLQECNGLGQRETGRHDSGHHSGGGGGAVLGC